jgi:ribonuclease D
MTPDTLRRVLWTPPNPFSDNVIRDRLRDLGARAWQIELVAPLILEAPDKPAATDE